jgi:hypothetical protein
MPPLAIEKRSDSTHKCPPSWIHSRLNRQCVIRSIVLGRIDEGYFQMISMLYFMRAYLRGLPLALDKADEKEIDFLGNYVRVVNGNRVGLWYAYREASNSIMLWQIRKKLDQKADILIDMVYGASEMLGIMPEDQIKLLDSLKNVSPLSESIRLISTFIQDIKTKKSQYNENDFIKFIERKKSDLVASARGTNRYRELALLAEMIPRYFMI